mgnify:FL=1
MKALRRKIDENLLGGAGVELGVVAVENSGAGAAIVDFLPSLLQTPKKHI